MYCSNCGSKISLNANFCNNCGTTIKSVNTNNVINNQSKKSHIGLIVVGCVIAAIVFIVGIIFFISSNTDKLICESKEGNITIIYNEKEIVGYTAINMKYDLHGQKKYAKQIGIKSYLSEFKQWFSNNTTGTCKDSIRNK